MQLQSQGLGYHVPYSLRTKLRGGVMNVPDTGQEAEGRTLAACFQDGKIHPELAEFDIIGAQRASSYLEHCKIDLVLFQRVEYDTGFRHQQPDGSSIFILPIPFQVKSNHFDEEQWKAQQKIYLHMRMIHLLLVRNLNHNRIRSRIRNILRILASAKPRVTEVPFLRPRGSRGKTGQLALPTSFIHHAFTSEGTYMEQVRQAMEEHPLVASARIIPGRYAGLNSNVLEIETITDLTLSVYINFLHPWGYRLRGEYDLVLTAVYNRGMEQYSMLEPASVAAGLDAEYDRWNSLHHMQVWRGLERRNIPWLQVSRIAHEVYVNAGNRKITVRGSSNGLWLEVAGQQSIELIVGERSLDDILSQIIAKARGLYREHEIKIKERHMKQATTPEGMDRQ